MADYPDPTTFSRTALDYFHTHGCDIVLLLYTRRLAAPLIGGIPVYNIHPSLLPAFPGLHGVRDARAAGARVVGATLHAVDNGLDSGPIVAQIATALPLDGLLANGAKISYMQKVFLILVLCDLAQTFGMTLDLQRFIVSLAAPAPSGITASPAIADPSVMRAFRALEQAERCTVFA